MENQVFQKVQTHEEYRSMIAKILKHMQSKLMNVLQMNVEKTIEFTLTNFSDQKNKIQQSEAMDPINALQNLTNQGTRNPMPPQMMNMGNQIGMGMGNVNTNPNVNVLQNLINVS